MFSHLLHHRCCRSGENNAAYPRRYNCSFPALIRDWRMKWAKHTDGATSPDFPFGWAQVCADESILCFICVTMCIWIGIRLDCLVCTQHKTTSTQLTATYHRSILPALVGVTIKTASSIRRMLPRTAAAAARLLATLHVSANSTNGVITATGSRAFAMLR